MDTQAKPLRIIPRREAQKRLNAGRSTLFDWNNPASKKHRPAVPKPVDQGGCSGFIEHEIDDYILGLMQARGGVAGQ